MLCDAVCDCRRLVRYRTAHNTSILEKKIEHLHPVETFTSSTSWTNCRPQVANSEDVPPLFRCREGGATYGTVREYGKCKDV